MGWMEDVFPFMVPNAVGDTRKEIEPKVSPYRGENGRFDPTAITSGMPQEVQDDAKLLMKIGDARRAAVDSYRPEPLSWNKWLGGALQEISVPVAYAQGNSTYAQQAMPNTILKQHALRQNAYEDERRRSMTGINDEIMTGVGNAALDYSKTQRDRRRAAKEMVAKSIAAASVRGPEAVASATKMAAQYLRSLGMHSDAASVESMAQTQAPASTPAAAGAQGAQPTSPAPQGAAPAGGAGGQPPQPQSALPNVQGGGVPISPKRQLAELVAPYNKEAAEALLKEAETEEAPGLEGAKELAKQSAQERVKLSVAQPGEERALRTTFDTLDGVEQTVDSLLSPDGQALSDGAASNVGGLWDTYAPNRPGGAAANAWAQIQKLRNNIGVMVLNAMREASKTGGAVGNVTEKEWPILQSQLAALDPNMSDDEFAASLGEIKKRISAIRANTARAYDQTYGTDFEQRLSRPEAAGPDARVSPNAASKPQPQAITPEQTDAIRERFSKADPQTQQSIVESLQRRGLDPKLILAPPQPKKPWYQGDYEEGFNP